jgi:hypothetical protein
MMHASDDTRYFRGNQFTCATGIGAWSFVTVVPAAIILLSGLSLSDFAHTGVMLVPAVAIMLLFFALLSLSLFYFETDSAQLVIRNHNLSFLKRTFLWHDVARVVLENNRAEILLHNGSKKVIRAESLKDEHWLALKQHLQNKNISVRDEVDYEVQTSPQGKYEQRRLYRGMALLLLVIGAVAALLIKRDVERWVLALWVMLGLLIGIVVVFLWYAMGGKNNNNDTDNKE